MTSKATSKIYKHPKAYTLYITIPSKLATDSKFPFKEGDMVEIEIDVASTLRIKKLVKAINHD